MIHCLAALLPFHSRGPTKSVSSLLDVNDQDVKLQSDAHSKYLTESVDAVKKWCRSARQEWVHCSRGLSGLAGPLKWRGIRAVRRCITYGDQLAGDPRRAQIKREPCLCDLCA